MPADVPSVKSATDTKQHTACQISFLLMTKASEHIVDPRGTPVKIGNLLDLPTFSFGNGTNPIKVQSVSTRGRSHIDVMVDIMLALGHLHVLF